MFGVILDILEIYVVKHHSLEIWHTIKERAACDVKDNGFLKRSYYEDQVLLNLVDASTEVLGASTEEILEGYGRFFLRYSMANGHEDMFKAQGTSLRIWLSNLNAMHNHIAKSVEGDEFCAPVFWYEDCDSIKGSILLHYYSLRGTLFVPLAVGIVEELALALFDVQIKLTQIALQGENGSDFTTWRITTIDPTKMYKLSGDGRGVATSASSMRPSIRSLHSMNKEDIREVQETTMPTKCPFSGMTIKPVDKSHRSRDSVESAAIIVGPPAASSTECLGMSASTMQTVFPFHVLVDREFRIIQVGISLPPLLQKEDLVGRHIGDIMQITRPVLCNSWNWKALRKLTDQDFNLTALYQEGTTPVSCRPKKKVSIKENDLKFKSSMIEIGNSHVMFVLSPDATNVVELKRMGLTLPDLPLHTSQRDAIFLGEYIDKEVDKANDLDKLSKQLESEKKLSNTLLYNMLPRKIANELRSGKSVKPESHDNVTLFFSDVVGFTSICDQIEPFAVVDMLNKLYSVMDYLASHFNLYKVETIGDAYMCCSGLPEPDEYHVENIANFAIAVSECVKLIRSPVDGSPITLRIGIHTGSCTAGVVGTLTPHYCLFGDMVNTTARHEQTGVADKIQCSSVLYGRLKHFSGHDQEQYRFTPRGLVDMKGKGECYTYWLEGGTEYNQHVNSSKMTALREEVEARLSRKSWKMRRYFGNGGLRDSISSRGTGTATFSTSSATSYLSDTDVDDVDDEDFEEHLCIGGDESDKAGSTCSPRDPFTQEPLHEKHDQGLSSRCSQEASRFCDLAWDSDTCHGVLLANTHHLMSGLLMLCLQHAGDDAPHSFDILDGQLHGFINRLSIKYSDEYCSSQAFLHATNSAIFANFLLESGQQQEEALIDQSPWYRFTVAFVSLVLNCKHTSVANEQFASAPVGDTLSTPDTSDHHHCHQAKHSIDWALCVLAEEFPTLYEEINWQFPRFLHLVRSSSMQVMKSISMFLDDVQVTMMERGGSTGAVSARMLGKRTEVALYLCLRMALVGQYAQNHSTFLKSLQADFDNSLGTYRLGKGKDPRRSSWFNDRYNFFRNEVMPVAEQCSQHLNCDVRWQALQNFQFFPSKKGKKWMKCKLSERDGASMKYIQLQLGGEEFVHSLRSSSFFGTG